MRRIYDGHLRKEYGTDEDRKEHEWKGRITFAVATTDEVDRHYSVFQSLGERFVMIRWGRPGGVEAALRAMNQNRDLGKGASRSSHDLFRDLPQLEPCLTLSMQASIAAIAEFAVRGRTHIPRAGTARRLNTYLRSRPRPASRSNSRNSRRVQLCSMAVKLQTRMTMLCVSGLL